MLSVLKMLSNIQVVVPLPFLPALVIYSTTVLAVASQAVELRLLDISQMKKCFRRTHSVTVLFDE